METTRLIWATNNLIIIQGEIMTTKINYDQMIEACRHLSERNKNGSWPKIPEIFEKIREQHNIDKTDINWPLIVEWIVYQSAIDYLSQTTLNWTIVHDKTISWWKADTPNGPYLIFRKLEDQWRHSWTAPNLDSGTTLTLEEAKEAAQQHFNNQTKMNDSTPH